MYAFLINTVGLEVKQFVPGTNVKMAGFRRRFKELPVVLVMDSASRYPARPFRNDVNGVDWTGAGGVSTFAIGV